MTDRPTDLSSLPSYRAAPPFAVLGAQVRADGLGRRRPRRRAFTALARRPARPTIFSSPAHAQVNNEVRKVAQPVGFADIVERVKPSVISVKVNINEKVAKDDNGNSDGLAVPAGFADGALLPPLRRTGWLPPGMRGGPRGQAW